MSSLVYIQPYWSLVPDGVKTGSETWKSTRGAAAGAWRFGRTSLGTKAASIGRQNGRKKTYEKRRKRDLIEGDNMFWKEH